MKFDEGFTDLAPICSECGHEMKPEPACTASGKTLRLYCSECDHEDAIVANRCFRCGSDNISIDDDDGFVLCVDCGMWTGIEMPLFVAIDWWNHSGDYAAGLERRIAELEAQLEHAQITIGEAYGWGLRDAGESEEANDA